MAKLSKDIRLKEQIKVEDGSEIKTIKIGFFSYALAIILLGIAIMWDALLTIEMLISAFRGSLPYPFYTFLLLILSIAIPTLPALLFYRWRKNKVREATVEKKLYKDVPNPEYDPEFAKKMRIRIKHSYGRYTLHKYDDGTYTIDDNDEFFTLHNFSFAGGDIITTTNGASFGNFTKPMGYSANFASSKSRQKKGKSTITFLNVSGDDTKQISAKITPNQAADLERFFYR